MTPSILRLVWSTFTCLTLTITCGSAWADNTTQWSTLRGNDGTGATQGTLPNDWSDTDYLWRYQTPGRDVGSMVIADQKVFFLTFMPKQSQLALQAVSLEGGSLLWERTYPIGSYHLHARNSYAASTPAIGSEGIYIAYADDNHTWLRCIDLQGEEIWARDFGKWQSDHGFATSPAVIGSTVLLYDSQQAQELPVGKAPSHERMIAVDAKTGTDRWISPLTATRTCYGIASSYQTEDGKQWIINAGTGNGIFALDAQSGEKVWELPVFDKRVVSCPIVYDNKVIASCGSGGGGNYVVAIDLPKRSTDLPQEAYRLDRAAAYVPTSAVYKGHLLMISDNGIASKTRIEDGETIWSQRVGGNYGASPIVVGDKWLIISLDGEAMILSCGDKFAKLGQVTLGAGVGATPAYADGKLLIRVGDEIRCLAVTDKS